MDHEQSANEETTAAITPSTPVRVNLRTAIAIIAVIVSVIITATGGYHALASTDKALDAKAVQLEKRLDTAVTKEDLRALRLDVREDLLNSVWLCEPSSNGAMKCRPSLPRAEVR